MNCIFICVFNQEKYIEMFLLLLESIIIYSNLDNNTNILVYTSTQFMNIIKKSYLYNDKIIKFEINDTYDNIDKACKARLDLFNLSSVKNYNKILYLDTDILVKDDINKVFNVCKKDILYVLEEGSIIHKDSRDFYGTVLFGNEVNKYDDKSAFTSGILLFNNCEKIKNLFFKINRDIINRPHDFYCHDQPYIIYNAFKFNLYNNKILKSLVVNNDDNINSDKVIHHFPGGPGIYVHKISQMKVFLNNLNKNYKNNMMVFDSNKKTIKNTKFPLIGLCVSYNYFDTLKFMLPVNFLHFEKIYLVTQKNDLKTIEFCKKFNNVIVLFYEFTTKSKSFDKYGALNYAQKIGYKNFPNHWYLIIDSDIILPNNFIDILNNEELNPECIYGAVRANVDTSYELLNKKKLINSDKNKNFPFNNILHDIRGTFPPSILGCFQLYKKHVYHSYNFSNAGCGDYAFGYDNFKLFCNLDNILYFHLGPTGKNWDGKVESFLDDIKISLNNIYFNCSKRSNNVYYNEKCELVKYGNSKNIDNDLWTCSEKFRFDIYNFFKDKADLKIAEIGAHKGYTTKILSNIFSKVYAVDNNVEWIDFNKNFNKNANNIEYVKLNIYKDSWSIFGDDIEVAFIDAGHSYEECKSDTYNCIKSFKNLKYIIFDDYGVWDGVRRVVDEFIESKILIFEKFIGITNVPGPSGIVYNVNEGIICSVNDFKNNILINKSYSWGDNYITFLDDFKMDAFGKGNYLFIEKNKILATFGRKEHIIEFNDNFTEFISTRKEDLCVVNGSFIFDSNLINKTYNWYEDYITFLNNFKISAFGDGYYKIIDKYNIIAYFGKKEHRIRFNEDYTEYTSIRTCDSFIVNGSALFDHKITNKTFSWEDSYITFLSRSKMIAPGKSSYLFIDNLNVIASFGNNEYNFKFNNDYTEYTAVRKNDTSVSFNGKLIFNYKIVNKKYSWGDSYILFLNNFRMEAFGKGYYIFIDNYTVLATFGKRIHQIKFNNDYSEFISTRKDDLVIVTGKVI